MLKGHRPIHALTGQIRHVRRRSHNPSPPALWISLLPNHLDVVILLNNVTTTTARMLESTSCIVHFVYSFKRATYSSQLIPFHLYFQFVYPLG